MTLKILLISSLLLAGCTADKVKRDIPPQIIHKWHTFDCGVPPATDKVGFKPVVWKIIDGRYTLSTDMYANLGDNMSEIKQATGQARKVIEFYINCIDAAQRNAEKKNGV